MEADSDTPEGPLSRERIAELRRIRNKFKREQKKAQKAESASDSTRGNLVITKGHVAVVTRDVFDKVNNAPADRHRNSRKRQELFGNLAELQAQQQCYASALQTNSKTDKTSEYNNVTPGHPGIAVANKLDKAKPVINKGKHSENPKTKQLSALKRAIIESKHEVEPENTPSHNYVDNIITDNLEALTCSFIKKLVELQEKYYKREPNKAAIKKRYIVGFHQLKKYIVIKKVHLFIIASDIKLHINDPLHLLIQELTNLAKEHQIPHVFALRRRQMGRLSLKQVPVTCFGVLNYDGLNEEFKALLAEVAKTKLKPEVPVVNHTEIYNTLLENIKKQLVL